MKGKRATLIILGLAIDLLLVLMFIQSVAHLSGSAPRYDLRLLREETGDISIGDINGDGKDDVLQMDVQGPFPSQRILHLFSPFIPAANLRYKFFFEKPVRAVSKIVQFSSHEATVRPNISLVELRTDRFIWTQFDVNGNITRAVELPCYEPPPAADTGNRFVIFEDLNADGQGELVLVVNSSYSGGPRGIVVYDLSRRRILWQYMCGCSPLFVRILDVNHDGRKEVLISGWSPHNGETVNGTDDDHSYLIMLDAATGREINKKVLGGYYTQVYFDIGDMNRDGLPEIIAAKGSHRVEPSDEPGEIRILQGTTLETLNYIQDREVGFSEIRMMGIRGGEPQCVVGDSAGRVSVWDAALNLKGRTKLEIPAVIRAVVPLGTEKKESSVFVQAGFNHLWILNEKLDRKQRLAIKDFSEMVEALVWEIHDGPKNDALVKTDRLYLVSAQGAGLSGLWPILSSRPAALLALLVLFNVFFLTGMRGARNAVVPSGMAPDSHWSEAAQEIVHRMKSALFTIQLEAEKLKSPSKGGERGLSKADVLHSSSSILDDVADLKRKIRSVMKLLEMRQPEVTKVDLAALIEQTVKRYEELLKGKIEFRLDLDRDAGQINLDESLFTEALSNLIENAVEALPRGGWIKITLTAIYSPVIKAKKAVEIEIEDNGAGIPSARLEEIFEPYYSTKKDGAGIGLPIARRVVEAHGGRLTVQSKEGNGTRFAIILPWKG